MSKYICDSLTNCILQRFAAVIMRIREPKTTALVFASGKMVVTGAKSEDDSRLASRKYARIIQKLGFNAKFTDFKIQNIVGSCDIKFPIRLEGLASRHHTFSSYEPELFPGLIYRMMKPKIVCMYNGCSPFANFTNDLQCSSSCLARSFSPVLKFARKFTKLSNSSILFSRISASPRFLGGVTTSITVCSRLWKY